MYRIRERTQTGGGTDAAPVRAFAATVPSRVQLRWLKRGVGAPGGKLPLFDRAGQEVPRRVIEACIEAGWAERWFSNPTKPDWIVCRLTARGRAACDLDERFNG